MSSISQTFYMKTILILTNYFKLAIINILLIDIILIIYINIRIVSIKNI